MIGVVIVTYNSEKYIETCLESLFSQGVHLKCFVVDNASQDQTISLVQKKFPQVSIVQNKKNVGFSKALNVGIKKCLNENCEEVLILNPDTKIESAALKAMLNRFRISNFGFRVNTECQNSEGLKKGNQIIHEERSIRKIGIVQPLITLMSDPTRINTWGNEYKGFGIVGLGGYRKEISNFEFLPSPKRCFGSAQAGRISNSYPTKISYASGACLLVKSEVFQKVGFIDERFFLYFEDTDFSDRVRKAGYEIVLAPEARVQHDYRVSRSLKSWGHFLLSWGKWMMK